MTCPFYKNFCTRQDTPNMLVLNWCQGNSFQMCDLYQRLEQQRILYLNRVSEIEREDEFEFINFGMGFEKPFRIEN